MKNLILKHSTKNVPSMKLSRISWTCSWIRPIHVVFSIIIIRTVFIRIFIKTDFSATSKTKNHCKLFPDQKIKKKIDSIFPTVQQNSTKNKKFTLSMKIKEKHKNIIIKTKTKKWTIMIRMFMKKMFDFNANLDIKYDFKNFQYAITTYSINEIDDHDFDCLNSGCGIFLHDINYFHKIIKNKYSLKLWQFLWLSAA